MFVYYYRHAIELQRQQSFDAQQAACDFVFAYMYGSVHVSAASSNPALAVTPYPCMLLNADGGVIMDEVVIHFV